MKKYLLWVGVALVIWWVLNKYFNRAKSTATSTDNVQNIVDMYPTIPIFNLPVKNPFTKEIVFN